MAVAADEAALRAEYDKVRGVRRADVRRRLGADRAVLPPGTPRRGADPRPGRRPGGRARRAGVLGAAPQPEAGRGVAVPGGHARAARAAAGRGASGPARRSATATPAPSSACSTRRTRRVLLPGDEHPAAGGAPGHRAGLRHRPGRGAAAGRRRRWRRPSTRTRWPRAGTPSSCGSTPRTRSGSCPAPARSRPGSSRPARGSGSTPATPPAPRSPRSTTR